MTITLYVFISFFVSKTDVAQNNKYIVHVYMILVHSYGTVVFDRFNNAVEFKYNGHEKVFKCYMIELRVYSGFRQTQWAG